MDVQVVILDEAIMCSLQIVGMLAGVRRRWKLGLTMTAAGLAVAVVGHVRDGNVPKSLDTARHHPIWNARGDFAIALDLLARESWTP